MSTTPQRIGKYELQKLLGSGSVGEVWKSYDLQYLRDVAIKIFYTDLQSDPNFMKRLLSHGQSLASLHHPNIVRILDANIARPKEANGTVAYMVMEYIEGSTLADSIQNTSHSGTFPVVADIVSLFTQLGAAIDYAHEHGIIHGNIKPANILLRPSASEEMGEPMLTDFGIARTTNGSARNSALYISPEQAKGLPPTRHSDIYSLGVILYEICTGAPPFRSESPVVLMMQHINMQPISPTLINANIPSVLSAVILRALA
jgi:eukaryotic-like serine/threonine-protein kinase